MEANETPVPCLAGLSPVTNDIRRDCPAPIEHARKPHWRPQRLLPPFTLHTREHAAGGYRQYVITLRLEHERDLLLLGQYEQPAIHVAPHSKAVHWTKETLDVEGTRLGDYVRDGPIWILKLSHRAIP